MTSKEALTIDTWIPSDKIKAGDLFRYDQIMRRAKKGIAPDALEAKFLNAIYSYSNGGGDKQDQPFKAYKRKTSWGINS